jgi:hypothetical protein
MELQQFNNLMPAAQEDAVWKYGIFLENTEQEDSNCEVYQVFDFFVGLYYQLHTSVIPVIIARPSRAQLPLLGKKAEITGVTRNNSAIKSPGHTS